ncbi:MAG: alpha/beta fold hydrolase, partial [Thaumarchaeota archaeon]
VGDGQYTIELFVDDLIALLDHLKIDKAILCGFSMGGYIALRAIERNPDRFSALILCDTMSAADSNEAKIMRANAIKQIKKEGVER